MPPTTFLLINLTPVYFFFSGSHFSWTHIPSYNIPTWESRGLSCPTHFHRSKSHSPHSLSTSSLRSLITSSLRSLITDPTHHHTYADGRPSHTLLPSSTPHDLSPSPSSPLPLSLSPLPSSHYIDPFTSAVSNHIDFLHCARSPTFHPYSPTSALSPWFQDQPYCSTWY